MTTSIIVSMYNRKPSTIDLVDALFFRSLKQHGSSKIELVILDDHSPLEQETKELFEKHKSDLQNQFGNVIFQRNEVNLGFGGSYNKGIELSQGDNLFIVNDDIYLPVDSVEDLASTLSKIDNAGMVGPITCEKMTFTYQYCKQAPQIKSYELCELIRIEEFAKHAKEKMQGKLIETDMISGFCFVIPKAVTNDYGGFDESFAYGTFEDTDLVRRVRQDMKIIINPSVYIHHGSVSGASNSLLQQPIKAGYFGLKNLLVYGRKWNDVVGSLVYCAKGIHRGLTGNNTVSELFD